MPSESEENKNPLVEVMRGPLARFHSAVAATIEQVRSSITDVVPSDNGGGGARGAELGQFARGRIATDRFEALLSDNRTVDPSRLRVMKQSLQVLSEIARSQDQLCQLTVSPGQSLFIAVGAALAELGRAFGAARVYELCCAGRYNETQHSSWLQSFPHARWTEAERSIAPPLIITVNGSDLRAGTLSEFLDGRQKLVLAVRGEMTAAPLAALISPRRFVVQTCEIADLSRLAEHDGPGVGAVVQSMAARFCHDPCAGSRSWERLSIQSVPESQPRAMVGGISPAQQREALQQLDELSRAPVSTAAPVSEGSSSPMVPAEKLASWILAQTDLSDLD